MKALLALFLAICGCYYAYIHYLPDASTLAAKRLAPGGVFYTTERFSEKTEHGVRALKAGSRVKLVKRLGGSCSVIDENNNEFKIPTELLTDDLDVRDALLKSIVDAEHKAAQGKGFENIVELQAKEVRVTRLNNQISSWSLELEQLQIKRARAEERLAAETAKTKRLAVSGQPMLGEQEALQLLNNIETQIKMVQRKIEDAQFAVKKEHF